MKRHALLSLVLIVLLAGPLFAGGEKEGKVEAKSNAMKVAFVYGSAVGDYGWYWSHDKARKATEKALNFVTTSYLENVKPGAEAERVLKELCEEGYSVIVSASADYESDVKKVGKDYPNVKFLICAGNTALEPNIESFYPKTSQVWYLLGQIAGFLTKTNTIGMVGSVVTPIDLQIQNAWLRGAQSVNPKVVERILFVNTYYDPAAEKDAALSLIDAGVDVIAQATNTPAHVQAAETAGIYAMSQYEDMRQFGPKAYVSGELFSWEKYYIPTLKAIRDGTWKPRYHNPDLTSGIVDLVSLGSMVTDSMKAVIEKSRQRMLNGEPEFFWEGPIKDNTGALKVKKGEKLSEEQLIGMDWWVEGVITAMRGK